MAHPLISGWPWYEEDVVDRQTLFLSLAFAGHPIPRCGRMSRLKHLDAPVVMYTNCYAHCGKGKELVLPGDPRFDTHPDYFCSEFLGDPARRPSVSLRVLWVGEYKAVIEYRSAADWRSNVGGEFFVLSVGRSPEERSRDIIREPMYAVDFVSDPWRTVAVDLNTCPGVPLEVINQAGREELVRSLKEFKR